MWPITHLVVGYLCYAALARIRERTQRGGPVARDGQSLRTGRALRDGPVLAAVFGAALPDLIDKPLLWAGAVPSGRTYAHSVFAALFFSALAWWLVRRYRREELGIAFAVGYVSHLAADVAWPLLVGAYDELGFLLWPIAHSPPYEGQKSLGTFGGAEVTTLWFEVVILAAGVALWLRQGAPGVALVRRAVRRVAHGFSDG